MAGTALAMGTMMPTIRGKAAPPEKEMAEASAA